MSEEIWCSESLKSKGDVTQAQLDLAKVAETPEGYRFLYRLLQRWGAETHVPLDNPNRMVLRNEAENILQDLGKVAPETCTHIILDLRGILRF